MTLLQPTDAPSCHIECIPSNSIAVQVDVSSYRQHAYSQPLENCYWIGVWAPRLSPMTCVDGSADLEHFVDNTCYDCEYHCESLELDMGGEEFNHWDHGYLTIQGTVYFNPPCTCYDEGVGSVEFPCAKGHEPETEEVSDVTLSCEFMNYGVIRHQGKYTADWACQQALYITASDHCIAGTQYRSVNTFDRAINEICWGNNTSPSSLLDVEMIFTTAPANEDLLSFESHQDNTEDCRDELTDIAEDLSNGDFCNATPVTYDGRAMGVATASIEDKSAYLLMAASGCKVASKCCFEPVSLYRDVAVDDDTVLDVWVTDVLRTGLRLMFLKYPNPSEGSILLGQIPADFNLEPCKSLKQQSSGAGELVNS